MKSFAVVLITLCIGFTGCGGGGGSSSTPKATVATLSSLQVSPPSTSLATGQSVQLKATGIFSDGTTQDVTSTATWSSNSPSATVTATPGVVLAAGVGTATITATSGAAHASASITVTGLALTSIMVTPASPSLAVGQTQQLAASGLFSDGSTADVTNSVAWTSDTPGVATVNMTTGMVAAVGTGTANITATSGGVGGTTPLTVTSAVLQSIDISPDTASIPVGGQQPFSVVGTFSDSTTQTLTNAAYTSSDSTIATIDSATGVATGVAVGANPVTITVAYGGFTDTAALTVLAPTLQSLAIAPGAMTIAVGTTTPFSLTGTFSDGSVETLTQGASWKSSSPAIAGVNGTGVATGAGAGLATISASYGGQTAEAALTVMLGAPVSISVTPAIPSIGVGGAVQFYATGVFADGSSEDLTSQVQWASSMGNIATISNAGVANALAKGTTQISAMYQGITGSTTLTVAPLQLLSITVTPANDVVPPHTSVQFVATGNYNNGTSSPLTGVRWYTSSGSFSGWGWWGNYISRTGLLYTSRRTGTMTVYASLNGIVGHTTLTVSTSAVTGLAITPLSPGIALGTTQQFMLTGTVGGTQVNLTQSAYWSTSNWRDAVIYNNGLALGTNPGVVTITANYQGKTAQATLTVSNATIVSVAVTPATPSIALGSSQQFAATGTFSDGSTQDVTPVSWWTSSNGAVAVMQWWRTPGLAISAGTGDATINATFKAQTGSTVLTVN